MQNQCAEIKLRAERRAGEILAEAGPKSGKLKSFHDGRISKPRLKELGVTEKQSHRWQAVANLRSKNSELGRIGKKLFKNLKYHPPDFTRHLFLGLFPASVVTGCFKKLTSFPSQPLGAPHFLSLLARVAVGFNKSSFFEKKIIALCRFQQH